SGEVYTVPYEGEKQNIKSETSGTIPVLLFGESALFKVKENKIIDIIDFETKSEKCKSLIEKDPARRNIAEFAIGCNDWAVVTGNILEDEKAGFHWAFGRSDQLGGVTGPDKFLSPENILHIDIVYAKDSKYKVQEMIFVYNDDSKKKIIEDTRYLVF
ncbi:MAG: hypothetical protein HQK54_12350, partial [Oligoflexales bacterium]|nr:hypothetical protein [Oligoflexales bacterium]